MDKRARKMLFAVLAFLGILFFFEYTSPKPLDWRPSYTSGDKVPFGCYVLFDQLSELFNGQEIEVVDQTPMEFLNQHEELNNANYVFINGKLGFDEYESEKLIEFVERGNIVFISAFQLEGKLVDTLSLDINQSYYSYGSDTVRTRLVNRQFKDRTYLYDKGSFYSYLTSYDTTRTVVLGETLPFEPYDGFISSITGISDDIKAQTVKEEKDLKHILSSNRKTPQVNFVEVSIGEGKFYYHLNPIAFTNYYLLKKGKHHYAAESLSYLNDGPIYWDDYGKSGRKVITSPLRFVLDQPALRYAYYLGTLLVVLFFIFGSKRRQRIIPVRKPLKNSSIEFARTIGQLFYQRGDASNIVEKKIIYFLSHIRDTYYLSTDQLNEDFMTQLAIKSQRSVDQVRQVIGYINQIKGRNYYADWELKELNRRIDNFLNNK